MYSLFYCFLKLLLWKDKFIKTVIFLFLSEMTQIGQNNQEIYDILMNHPNKREDVGIFSDMGLLEIEIAKQSQKLRNSV